MTSTFIDMSGAGVAGADTFLLSLNRSRNRQDNLPRAGVVIHPGSRSGSRPNFLRLRASGFGKCMQDLRSFR